MELSFVQQTLDLKSNCPWMVPNSDDWIYITPAIIVLSINILFLFRIMWVSWSRCTHSSTRIPSKSNEAHISIIKKMLPVMMSFINTTKQFNYSLSAWSIGRMFHNSLLHNNILLELSKFLSQVNLYLTK